MVEHCALREQIYRRRHSAVDVDIALGNSGDVQIELIFQHKSNELSIYNEINPAGHRVIPPLIILLKARTMLLSQASVLG